VGTGTCGSGEMLSENTRPLKPFDGPKEASIRSASIGFGDLRNCDGSSEWAYEFVLISEWQTCDPALGLTYQIYLRFPTLLDTERI
jgi:hypothetical protein